jgi:hypothetical protein
MIGPFSITPSNLVLGMNGMNQMNSTTALGGGHLTISNRTPKGILTNRPEKMRLLTPIAQSPMNKMN